MRRGETLGLRWEDADLARARLSVRQALVSIDGMPQLQTVKSHRSVRTIELDDDTVAVLRARRAAQVELRLGVARAGEDHGLVFSRDDGHWENPDWVGEQFRRHVRPRGYLGSGRTT